MATYINAPIWEVFCLYIYRDDLKKFDKLQISHLTYHPLGGIIQVVKGDTQTTRRKQYETHKRNDQQGKGNRR